MPLQHIFDMDEKKQLAFYVRCMQLYYICEHIDYDMRNVKQL